MAKKSTKNNDDISELALSLSYKGEKVDLFAPIIGQTSTVNPTGSEEAILFSQAEVIIQDAMRLLYKKLIDKGLLQ